MIAEPVPAQQGRDDEADALARSRRREGRARLDNPTPDTRANVANFHGTVRSLCHVLAEWECGEAGFCTTWRFTGNIANLTAHARHMVSALSDLSRIPGISAFRVLLADDAASTQPTAEKRLRDRVDGVTPYTLILESPGDLSELREIHKRVEASFPGAIDLPVVRGVYRAQLTMRSHAA